MCNLLQVKKGWSYIFLQLCVLFAYYTRHDPILFGLHPNKNICGELTSSKIIPEGFELKYQSPFRELFKIYFSVTSSEGSVTPQAEGSSQIISFIEEKFTPLRGHIRYSFINES